MADRLILIMGFPILAILFRHSLSLVASRLKNVDTCLYQFDDMSNKSWYRENKYLFDGMLGGDISLSVGSMSRFAVMGARVDFFCGIIDVNNVCFLLQPGTLHADFFYRYSLCGYP